MIMKFIIGFIGVAIVTAGVYFFLSFSNNKAEASPKDQVVTTNIGVANPLVAYWLSNTERALAEKQIGEVKNKSIFLQRMIEMSLQKVQIGNDQYGIPGIAPNQIHRIQMTEGNIEYLKEKLHQLNISNKNTYENILNRWLVGNFQNVDNDVQTLLSDLKKTNQIGGSFQVSQRSFSEENQYITRFFISG